MFVCGSLSPLHYYYCLNLQKKEELLAAGQAFVELRTWLMYNSKIFNFSIKKLVNTINILVNNLSCAIIATNWCKYYYYKFYYKLINASIKLVHAQAL